MHPSGYWIARWLFERGVAVTYLIAFACVVNQFIPLSGERGLLPVPAFIRRVRFRDTPSLFFYFPTDRAFRICGWAGLALSAVALSGVAEAHWWSSALVWALLWVLYLSFVNVGQTFYGFGWESILLEAGFFTIFAGSSHTAPQFVVICIWRWILFRVMFGAGLIKLRADPCWKKLTCLDYHFETQPIPNGLSWQFHWMPSWVHKAGVLYNHFVELVVPFGYFAPQPVATVAALLTILFQVILMLSGNLSWLNFITIVLAVPALDDRLLRHIAPVAVPPLHAPGAADQVIVWIVAAAVAAMSIRPVLNMLSAGQIMNFSYNPLHLVGTYGAFGGVTRARYEIVVEGTSSPSPAASDWKEYEFRGKPGNPFRRGAQIAPYHLRLDWLMWFAAMRPNDVPLWFSRFLVKLLAGERAALSLLKTNPFPDAPPRYIRALLYEYRFTTPGEHRAGGRWWDRTLMATYVPPTALRVDTREHHGARR
jgi:hypothetical protein